MSYKIELITMVLVLLTCLALESSGSIFTATPLNMSKNVGQNLTLMWSYTVKGGGVDHALVGYQKNVTKEPSIMYKIARINETSPGKDLTEPFNSTMYVNHLTRVNSINGTIILQLQTLSLNHAGYYSCSVSSVFESIESSEVQLIVSEPPYEIHTNVSNVVALEGQTLAVLCTAKGTPIPVVTWVYNGLSEAHLGNGNGSALISFKDIKRENHGSYVCEAENRGGKKSSKAVLVNVTYPPTIKNLTSSEEMSYIGQNVTFRCCFDGNPKPTFKWSTPNPYADYSYFFEDYSATLRATFNSSADFGNYTCLVNNSFGSTSRSINVTQLHPPGVVVFQESDIRIGKVYLSWKEPSSNGGSPIIFYDVSRIGDSQPYEAKGTKYTFTKLVKNKRYTFCVRAKNKVGFGDKKCINVTTYVASTPFPKFTSSSELTSNSKFTPSPSTRGTAEGKEPSKGGSELTTIIVISVLLALLVAAAIAFFILWIKRRSAREAQPVAPENHMAGPVNGDLYAMVDNSNKSKKKPKNKSDLVYAELSDIAPAGEAEKPPSYQPTDYADISHVLTPNADIVYSNVQPPCAQEGAYANVHDLNE